MSAYRRTSAEEIDEAGRYDLLRVFLMIQANGTLSDAEAQATGQKKREPAFHESGWKITLHDGSEKSAVGLWSCWLQDKFYLGYPKTVAVPDELIMEVLNVEYASAVTQVSAIAVNDPNYEGEFKDSDKPLEVNKAGQIVAYQTRGSIVWAPFFGPQEENGGRVWIEKSDSHYEMHDLPLITPDGRLAHTYFGHSYSNGICTSPFSYHNKYSPESPTTDPEAIQKYRERFFELAVETALLVGQPSKMTIDYGFVMVPEDLEREGYENIAWLKGRAGTRLGWGNELVRAETVGEIVLLKSGNSIVPWSTIRQREVPESKRNREGLVKIVRDSLTF